MQVVVSAIHSNEFVESETDPLSTPMGSFGGRCPQVGTMTGLLVYSSKLAKR